MYSLGWPEPTTSLIHLPRVGEEASSRMPLALRVSPGSAISLYIPIMETSSVASRTRG